MAGLIEISAAELERLIRRVQAASDSDLRPLLDSVGQQQEDAARARITRTKRAPDGTRWKAWTPRYARTRSARHSLLVGEGELAQRMTHQEVLARKAVLVGSTMEYAGAQLFGSPQQRIPAREYLDTQPGFADADDRGEIRALVLDWLEDALS